MQMGEITVIDIIALIACGLFAFWGMLALAHEYGRRTGWQTPEGHETSNWAMRNKLAVTLGAIAMIGCALVCWRMVDAWVPRLLIMGQAALLAAAGASDLRKFHLPLPLSLAGMALGIITLALVQPSLFVVVFAAMWAAAVIVLHTLASKGSMQLGDHIATVWIALVMPVNGMLAILAGDLANVVFARIKGLRGKKVAAAGPWLLIAAAILALPPYFAWLQPAQPSVARVMLVVPHSLNVASATQHEALVLALDLAGDQTASVALANDRAGRIAQARQAAEHVRVLAQFARNAGAEPNLIASLDALADGLARYDVAGVRAAAAQIASQRAALAASHDSRSLMTQ